MTYLQAESNRRRTLPGFLWPLAFGVLLCAIVALPAAANNDVSSKLNVENETDDVLRFEVVHVDSGKVAKKKTVAPGKDGTFTFNFKDCHQERTKHRRVNVIHRDSETRIATIEVYATVSAGGKKCNRDYVFRGKKIFSSDYRLSTRISESLRGGWLTVKSQ